MLIVFAMLTCSSILAFPGLTSFKTTGTRLIAALILLGILVALIIWWFKKFRRIQAEREQLEAKYFSAIHNENEEAA